MFIKRLFVTALIFCPIVSAMGQEIGEKLQSSSERIARARWQPIRQSVEELAEDLPPPLEIEGELGQDNSHDPTIETHDDSYYDQRYEEGAYYGEPLGSPSCGSGECGCRSCCNRKPWMPLFCLGVPTDGWVSAEYLSWYQKGMRLPPLVTTSDALPGLGVLGEAGTSILVGGSSDYADERQDGIRWRLGLWLDSCHKWAIEAEHFSLDDINQQFSATGNNGNPILARPFFNVLNGGFEDSELVSVPNVVDGNVSVALTSDLNGQSVHLRRLLCCGQGCGSGIAPCAPCSYCTRLEGLIGWRRLELRESLTITETLSAPGGVGFNIVDDIRTSTEFNGFNFGLFYRRQRGRWGLEMFGKFAIGSNTQRVTINGQTTVSANGVVGDPEVGGLLAQRTNIGNYDRTRFAVVPEFGLNVGWNWTNNLRIMAGYTFIYWNNVVRPGDQIDRDVNPNLLPTENVTANPFGALRPGFEFRETDYWVQGWNLGLELRF